MMLQEVTVHVVADRHRGLHERQFARTEVVLLSAEDAVEVLARLGVDAEPGRCVVTFGEPFDYPYPCPWVAE